MNPSPPVALDYLRNPKLTPVVGYLLVSPLFLTPQKRMYHVRKVAPVVAVLLVIRPSRVWHTREGTSLSNKHILRVYYAFIRRLRYNLVSDEQMTS